MQDGSELPTQERLVEEFRMSKQAVREGLHILEVEGLITIRRGNVGGALVHLPSPNDAAYNFALVMQARGVRLEAVGAALTKLEPVCVGLCTERADRAETVVPRLRAAVDRSVANITDLAAWLESQSLFHRILASDCGNEALAVLAGSLEAVWACARPYLGGRSGQCGGVSRRRGPVGGGRHHGTSGDHLPHRTGGRRSRRAVHPAPHGRLLHPTLRFRERDHCSQSGEPAPMTGATALGGMTGPGSTAP